MKSVLNKYLFIWIGITIVLAILIGYAGYNGTRSSVLANNYKNVRILKNNSQKLLIKKIKHFESHEKVINLKFITDMSLADEKEKI